MKQSVLLLGISFCTLLFVTPGYSHGKLSATELEEKFSDTTQLCRKEKDRSTCTTYFSADGVIKRRLHKDNVRREGTWEADLESDQLCITWKGKTKALCFDVYRNKDGTYDMYKGGKHLSTVLSFASGNREQL